MYQGYKDQGLFVMMVFEGSSNDTAKTFADEYGLTFPVLTDTTSRAFDRFDADRQTPYSVFFDEGAVVYSRGVSWYTDYIESVLGT